MSSSWWLISTTKARTATAATAAVSIVCATNSTFCSGYARTHRFGHFQKHSDCLNAQLYKADTKTNRFPSSTLLLHRRRRSSARFASCCSHFRFSPILHRCCGMGSRTIRLLDKIHIANFANRKWIAPFHSSRRCSQTKMAYRCMAVGLYGCHIRNNIVGVNRKQPAASSMFRNARTYKLAVCFFFLSFGKEYFWVAALCANVRLWSTEAIT